MIDVIALQLLLATFAGWVGTSLHAVTDLVISIFDMTCSSQYLIGQVPISRHCPSDQALITRSIGALLRRNRMKLELLRS